MVVPGVMLLKNMKSSDHRETQLEGICGVYLVQPPVQSKNKLGQNLISLLRILKNIWASDSFSKALNYHRMDKKTLKSHISPTSPEAPLLLSGHLLISLRFGLIYDTPPTGFNCFQLFYQQCCWQHTQKQVAASLPCKPFLRYLLANM